MLGARPSLIRGIPVSALESQRTAAEADRMIGVSLPACGKNFAAAIVAVMCAWSLTACDASPWEQGPSVQTVANERDRAVVRVFYANAATVGAWIDKRPSGSMIRHGMLIVDEPRLPSRDEPRGGRIEIISQGPELQKKVEDIIADRIPIAAGMKTHFALGRTVPVRIERVDAEGVRTVVGEGRVAFLELKR